MGSKWVTDWSAFEPRLDRLDRGVPLERKSSVRPGGMGRTLASGYSDDLRACVSRCVEGGGTVRRRCVAVPHRRGNRGWSGAGPGWVASAPSRTLAAQGLRALAPRAANTVSNPHGKAGHSVHLPDLIVVREGSATRRGRALPLNGAAACKPLPQRAAFPEKPARCRCDASAIA